MKLVPLTLAVVLATTFSGTVLAGGGEGSGGNNDNNGTHGNPVFIGNHTFISNDMEIVGGAHVNGWIAIGSESKAILDNSQSAIGNTTFFEGGRNDAKVDGGSGNNAQGNLGINVAAGAGNAQSNEVALSAIDASQVFAAAQTFSTQTSVVNGVVSSNTENNAKISDSLQGVKGNVGVNVAAGAGNLQDNQLAASVNTSGTLAMATGSNNQVSALNEISNSNCYVDNDASISHGALSGAQGNIGANVAAGFGNLQHNSLSIAVASGK
jgi:hypothetical protein